MSTKQRLTTWHLQRIFDVSAMTVYNWRRGTATKTRLPCAVEQNGRVHYTIGAVKAWARKNAVPLVEDPGQVATMAPRRRGPRGKQRLH